MTIKGLKGKKKKKQKTKTKTKQNKKPCQSRILCLAKLFLKNEGEIKPFPVRRQDGSSLINVPCKKC